MNLFNFIISTPSGKCFDDKIRSVSLRGGEGDLAVFAGHIPFVTSVVPCKCIITLSDGTKREGQMQGGILSVKKEQTSLISGSFEFK